MNSSHTNPGRRGFFRTCVATATAVAVNPLILAQNHYQPKFYNRAILTDPQGTPLNSNSLEAGQSYLFNYPYITTPCFAIRLNQGVNQSVELSTAGNESYNWPGGIGPDNAIVAFSAICAHKLSYPTKGASFINFRPEDITYMDHEQQPIKSRQLIYCCSERSVYDPANGAKVLGGPAPQPLTTILLEYDENSDNYFAVGTLGGEMYEPFFEKFGFRIALEYKNDDIHTLTKSSTAVYTPTEYTDHQVSC